MRPAALCHRQAASPRRRVIPGFNRVSIVSFLPVAFHLITPATKLLPNEVLPLNSQTLANETRREIFWRAEQQAICRTSPA
jgi:hypothetical protein